MTPKKGRPADQPERFESVTAVLGSMPKHLAWWASNAAAERAVKNRKKIAEMSDEDAYNYIRRAHHELKSEAADIGSQVHALLEAYNLGQKPTFPIDVAQHMEAYHHFLEEEKPVIHAAECKVYSRRYKTAGTLDMIADVRGRRAVLDHKTGKAVYPEAAMQLAAYASMDFLIADPNHPGARQHTPARGRRWYEWDGPPEDELPMPEIEAAYVLHLPRKGGYKLFEVPDLDAARDAWEKVARPLDWFKRVGEKDLLTEVGEWKGAE